MNHPRPGNALSELLQPGPDCYAPEDLLPEAIAAMAAADREQLRVHLECCACCSAEHDLALEFEASPERMHRHEQELDFVVSRLHAASPVGAHGSQHGRRSLPVWAMAAAAAVLLVASVGVLQLGSEGPALPDRPATTTLRGGALELVGPVGLSSEWPASLDWVAFEGAAEYRVNLVAPDGTILGAEFVTGDEIALERLISTDLLRNATVYSWEVVALDAEGRALAHSERATFRVMERLRGS